MASTSGSLDAQLQKLVKKLQALPEVIEEANHAAAEAWIDLIDEGFSTSRDPYGNKWKNKVRPNGYPILQSQRNKLWKSIKITRVSAKGFSIGTSVPYGDYHMTGTSRMVARPFLPYTTTIPPKYLRAYKQAFTAALKRHFNQ